MDKAVKIVLTNYDLEKIKDKALAIWKLHNERAIEPELVNTACYTQAVIEYVQSLGIRLDLELLTRAHYDPSDYE